MLLVQGDPLHIFLHTKKTEGYLLNNIKRFLLIVSLYCYEN